MTLPDPPLLVITDRRQARRPLEEIAEAVFAAGGRWLLLREKDMDAGARAALLRRLVALAVPFGARVLVSADAATARNAGAAGVHLSRAGDVAAARAALGPGALIGRSAHDPDEAESAARDGVGYVTLSPVFASASKPGYGPALGVSGLRAVAHGLAVPVLALGGVTARNAAACRAAGAAGVAVMGPVMRAPDPAAAVADLVHALER